MVLSAESPNVVGPKIQFPTYADLTDIYSCREAHLHGHREQLKGIYQSS